MIKNSFNVALYTFAAAAQGGATFILLPFLSANLSLEDFALLSLITAASAILQAFIAFNSVSYPVVAYHEQDQQLTNLARNFHSIFLVSLFPITIIILLFDTLDIIKFFNIGFFIAAHAAVSVLMLFRLSMLQMAEKPFLYFICQLTTAVTGLGLTYILITNFSMELQGRLIGLVGSLLFVIAIMYIFDRPATFLNKLSFRFDDLVDTIKYGVSFLLYKLVKQVRGHLDKFIAAALIGMTDLAILAMAIYSKLRKGNLLSELAMIHLFNHLLISSSLIYLLGTLGAAIGYMISYFVAVAINMYCIRSDLFKVSSYAI